MLTESRYSITIKRLLSARGQDYALAVVTVLLAVIIVGEINLLVMIFTGVVAILTFCWPLSQGHDSSPCKRVLVSESGTWQEQSDPIDLVSSQWQIASSSKLLPVGIIVNLHRTDTRQRQCLWVFPNQTSDESYRRLARIVFRQGLK